MEMIKIIILTVLLFCFSPSFGQNGVYSAQMLDGDNYTFSLSMNGGIYWLMVSMQSTPDVYFNKTISFGECQSNCNRLVLVDKKSGYKLVFKKKRNGELKQIHGFYFLSIRPLKYVEKEELDLSRIEQGLPKLIDDRELFRQRQSNNLIIEGLYAGDGYELRFMNGEDYEYSMGGVLMSVGKYFQEGCLLSFYDIDMEDPFFAVINGQGLYSRFLPGDFEGIYLKRKF